MTRVRRPLLLVALALGAAACTPATPGSDGGVAQDGGACASFATAHERLLNAPTSAAVVRKVPAVPDGGFP